MSDEARIPRSTYRLQITPEFTLTDAAELVPYLRRLGVDWVYVSPILQAEAGSQHGYDVTDHSRIDRERGGEEGFDALVAAAREEGMGLLVDIVPNHVGVATPAQNPWWWDLLTHGRESRYAEAFDVDWETSDGRILIPVLGDSSTADLVVEGDELVYFDNRYPIAPGTGGDDAQAVHDRQHYRLVDWRLESTDLNYRRFFAVSTLAAVRVEVPWVFDESHAEIRRWFDEGLADGLRVDHPDGLADPGGYISDLAELTGGRYVLIEKILEGDEPLHPDWPSAGTTGYDALAILDRVFVDPAGEAPLTALADELRGRPQSYTDLIHDTKRAVADGILQSEVRRLARDIVRAGDIDATDDAAVLHDGIAELLTCFPVYRSYLPHGTEAWTETLEAAKQRRPDLAAVLDDLAAAFQRTGTAPSIRFQQTSGMVMAKGVEDCAFYRYTRLTSLTEVGAEPQEFSVSPARFHELQAHRASVLPDSMTTLSTHDTKRSEDTRARISALAEIPGEWADALGRLREAAPVGDGSFENLLWQAVVGAWPLSRERAHAYAEKAAREAGDSTAWLDVDEEFEARMHAAVDAAYDDPAVREIVEDVVARLREAGWSNSLGEKLVQLTAPGVPDVYQGTELWDRSLVDPDNRRPVDYRARVTTLDRLDGGWTPPVDDEGAAKLLVVSRALRLRRDRPELFTGYRPLVAEGEGADHVLAFDRGGAITVATRLPIGLAARGGWGDTEIELPGGELVDLLTGRRLDGGRIRLADLLSTYPVALVTEPED
ncbi:malto-oligosyltrehalose synthase [Cnuibacter physcomitrellae]|uniref:malto-oligosyltrehalose synthase n=1 Tax=Cnuibacter physcomitrellae TaxID=1619308 RepID=UPI002175E226|nr:malto-oligosyltrehalose synthase [Cnuibacter physcomitrellae]MCS5499086.1 malto-oligosyltrehalose synthase [Cnuibacter physcomitrellae]